MRRARSAGAPLVNFHMKCDELASIKGISRAVERRLHACGVLTFQQLGDMTAQEVAERLKSMRGVTAKRIEREDWIGQARELAARAAEPGSSHERLINQGFVVDLFLGADGEVRLTQVLHVKGNQGDAWQGWDERRLLDFMIQQAGVTVPVVEETPLVAAAAESVPDGVRLREVEVVRRGTETLERDREFQVKLSFDLDDSMRTTTRPLAYRATVRATRKPDGLKVVLAEATGRLAPSADALTVAVPKGRLDAGIYSFRADLAVTRASGPAESPLRGEASIPAGMFQVV